MARRHGERSGDNPLISPALSVHGDPHTGVVVVKFVDLLAREEQNIHRTAHHVVPALNEQDGVLHPPEECRKPTRPIEVANQPPWLPYHPKKESEATQPTSLPTTTREGNDVGRLVARDFRSPTRHVRSPCLMGL
jgi:hypothetical protein